MTLTATEFEYDGIKSSVYGLYLCDFNGSNTGTKSIGNEVTIKNVKSPTGKRFIKTGSTYETPLSFTFQVMKYDDRHGAEEITARELARIMRWLIRSDNYHYLRFMQDEWDNIFYNCSLKVQKYEVAGTIYGLEIEATCDAPWGYSEMKEFEFTLDSNNRFHLYNYSDEDGRILPDLVKITVFQDCDLILKNSFSIHKDENNKFISKTRIDNCRSGEIIQLDKYRNIKSSVSHDALQNDFNYQFLELCSDFVNQKNTISANFEYQGETITGNCNVEVFYREIRKGVC